MEKIVGKVVSKNSKRSYPVKWISDEQTSWILRDSDIWMVVCTKVETEDAALLCAQNFIDFQTDLY